jgi:hypothetical protein
MNSTDRLLAVQFTTCPACGEVAEIVHRTVLESTDGPIEHAKVRCTASHHFLLPTACLDQRTEPRPHAVSTVRPRR